MKHELKCLGKMKLKSLLNSIQLKNDYKALVSKLNSDHRMNIFNVGEFINKHGKNLNAEATSIDSSSTKSRPNNKPSKEDLWRFVNNFTDVQDFNVLRKIFDVLHHRYLKKSKKKENEVISNISERSKNYSKKGALPKVPKKDRDRDRSKSNHPTQKYSKIITTTEKTNRSFTTVTATGRRKNVIEKTTKTTTTTYNTDNPKTPKPKPESASMSFKSKDPRKREIHRIQNEMKHSDVDRHGNPRKYDGERAHKKVRREDHMKKEISRNSGWQNLETD